MRQALTLYYKEKKLGAIIVLFRENSKHNGMHSIILDEIKKAEEVEYLDEVEFIDEGVQYSSKGIEYAFIRDPMLPDCLSYSVRLDDLYECSDFGIIPAKLR